MQLQISDSVTHYISCQKSMASSAYFHDIFLKPHTYGNCHLSFLNVLRRILVLRHSSSNYPPFHHCFPSIVSAARLVLSTTALFFVSFSMTQIYPGFVMSVQETYLLVLRCCTQQLKEYFVNLCLD